MPDTMTAPLDRDALKVLRVVYDHQGLPIIGGGRRVADDTGLPLAEALTRLDGLRHAGILDRTVDRWTFRPGAIASLGRLLWTCPGCGCTEDDACEGGCWWARENPPVCSSCIGTPNVETR